METVLIEAGGTKTEVFRFDGRSVHSTMHPGIHPARPIQDNEEALKGLCNKMDVSSISKVYYYGTGVEIESFMTNLRSGLAQIFKHSEFEIFSDLSLVGHALRGLQGSGFVGIFGTGSNFGFMNKGELQIPFPALGYIMGDEGSGVHLGRLILQHWSRKQMPEDTINWCNQLLGTPKKWVSDIYGSSAPNQVLASLVKKVSWSDAPDAVLQLVDLNFEHFFDSIAHLETQSKDKHIAFTGGVAEAFESRLQAIGKEYGWEIEVKNSLAELWFQQLNLNP